ncbi:hypothetical protein Tco_1191266 [Tanacetum coccineum]|uniref:Uncharacterized protein n=1 Tax=Tanacetum coccineum TaxID=301880 RepID=A0ABQ5BXZ4_9ASTR
MSLQEMEDLKQHYLDEMLSLSNDLGIKDYWNEKIDICFRRECEDTIDELKGKFNGMSIEINKKRASVFRTGGLILDFSSQRFFIFFLLNDEMIMITDKSIFLKRNRTIHYLVLENLVPIPCELSMWIHPRVISDCNFHLSRLMVFSSINLPEEKSVTFSNPLFDSNDDFTSSDDESLFDEDRFRRKIQKLFEPSFLNSIRSTPLFDVNEDECFDPGGDIDEIDAFLDIDVPTNIKDSFHDSKGDIII